MSDPTWAFDAFDRLLARETGPWSAAKRDAFARLAEAYPGPRGPTPAGLRQMERGQFDARIPAEWKPVFTEVYHQWLGFAEEHEALGQAAPLSLGWWFRPGWLRGLPPGMSWIVSPASLVSVLLALLAWRCTEGLTIRSEAAHVIDVVAASADTASLELAEAERSARASFAAPSDAVIASFLATEPSLRSRFESATARIEELTRRIEDGQAALDVSRFPRWPRQPVGRAD